MLQLKNMMKEQKSCIMNNYHKYLEKVPKHDLLVVVDDFNAKMGNDNKGYENILRKNGIGILNDNGQRLIDFFQLNDLVISGSLF